MALFEAKGLFYKAGEGSGGGSEVTSVNGKRGAVVTIDDNSTTSTTESWSASKLYTMIGDVETLLSQI